MAENEKVFVPRWGDAALDDKDYVTIPGLILRNCAAAGVEPEQLAFIAQVMSFKYDTPNSAARPSVASIAKRLGVSSDTARRYKNGLIDKGLMEFQPQCDEKGYSIAPDILTFAGLVRKCRELDTPSCKSAIPPLANLPYKELEDKNYQDQNLMGLSPHAAGVAAASGGEPPKTQGNQEEAEQSPLSLGDRDSVPPPPAGKPRQPKPTGKTKKPSNIPPELSGLYRGLMGVLVHAIGINAPVGDNPRAPGGRMAPIAMYLLGIEFGKNPVLSPPRRDEKIVDDLTEFVEWWTNQRNQPAMMRNLDKFIEWWHIWQAQHAPQAAPAEDDPMLAFYLARQQAQKVEG